MPTFNHTDLKEWKNSQIWTDSLWIIDSRDNSGKHQGDYHGNFVPQIPRQFILRYSKKGDTVLDPFLGSGTTAYEAETLERNFIGIDIQPKMVELVQSKIEPINNFSELIVGDSSDKSSFCEVTRRVE